MVEPIKNQKGQAIVEAILLMVVFLATTVFVTKFFVGEEVISGLVKKPWEHMSGLLQNGVMDNPNRGKENHPNKHNRHISLKGDPP